MGVEKVQSTSKYVSGEAVTKEKVRSMSRMAREHAGSHFPMEEESVEMV